MTFLTGDRPTEEGRGLENDGGGGRNERLGVEIEMALKHVMLRKEREREYSDGAGERRPSFERRFIVFASLFTQSVRGSVILNFPLLTTVPSFSLTLNWFTIMHRVGSSSLAAARSCGDKIYRKAPGSPTGWSPLA